MFHLLGMTKMGNTKYMTGSWDGVATKTVLAE